MKQKISNKTLRRILIPVMAVILVITVAANIGMNAFASVMDDYLGRGELQHFTAEGSEIWDTQYYEDLFVNMEES